MLIPFKDIVRKYGKPKGILHIGANIGEEADAYYNAGVKTVCWIEANPELLPTLRANVDKYGHKVIPACVGDMEGFEVVFHVSNNAGQSSSFLELGTHKTQHPEVHYVKDIVMKTRRLDQMSCWGGYDFIALDIQGAELKALKGLGDYLKDFKYVYAEVNRKHVYKDCALLPEMDAYLKGFGFKRVAIAPWIGDWTDALWIKK